MSDKPEKIKAPTEKQYREERISLALEWAPTIRPCKQCKWPVVDGYCCRTCGSDEP